MAARPGNEHLASTGILTRLNLRRERIIAPVTVGLLIATNAATVSSIRTLYGTVEERQALAAGAAGNSAFKLLLGPLEHVQSDAAIASWRAGLFMIATAAVCAVLMVTRLTRKEEELGRVELIRAARTGRLAPMTAAVLVALGFALVVGAGMAALMSSGGATGREAALVGGQYASTSLAAIGLAALTAQIATTARLANLLAVSVVLGGYVVRGAGDAAGWEWLHWTNPVGWAQRMDPFGAGSWWPALLSVVVFVAGVAAATWVSGHRDLEGGLVAPRPGPPSSGIASIGALTARLNRGGFFGWMAGIGVFALLIGILVNAASSLTEDNPQMVDYLHRLGGPGELTKVFFAVIMSYLGFAAATWAVTAMSRVRADESAGRTEVLLATPASRGAYLASQLALVMVGIAVLLLVSGVLVGIGAGAVTGDWATMLSDSVRGAAVQIPAALVIGVGVVALYGIAPRLVVGGGWAMVVGAFLLGPMGELFGLPQAVRNLSPFTHLPAVPSAPMSWGPIVVLSLVVAALAGAGWWWFRRRDIEGM
ncbi:putative polyketide ABC transporter permease protein [Gordonia araii NBRC 100433]|uniref:Putative polyketide ABC transporter permease protein n=1 Tax=Gordonia araii NBRC 100433 TaxID=1073574 RepID=G7H3E9_9ACTN|nr:putative polyketide ABC transporter permease protein [Gordonia araii NBRC 100433]